MLAIGKGCPSIALVDFLRVRLTVRSLDCRQLGISEKLGQHGRGLEMVLQLFVMFHHTHFTRRFGTDDNGTFRQFNPLPPLRSVLTLPLLPSRKPWLFIVGREAVERIGLDFDNFGSFRDFPRARSDWRDGKRRVHDRAVVEGRLLDAADDFLGGGHGLGVGAVGVAGAHELVEHGVVFARVEVALVDGLLNGVGAGEGLAVHGAHVADEAAQLVERLGGARVGLERGIKIP